MNHSADLLLLFCSHISFRQLGINGLSTRKGLNKDKLLPVRSNNAFNQTLISVQAHKSTVSWFAMAPHGCDTQSGSEMDDFSKPNILFTGLGVFGIWNAFE